MALGSRRDPVSGALQQNYAATGAKRYGENGSMTATSGALPPEGYLDRETKKRMRRRAIQRRVQQNSQASIATPLGGQVY